MSDVIVKRKRKGKIVKLKVSFVAWSGAVLRGRWTLKVYFLLFMLSQCDKNSEQS